MKWSKIGKFLLGSTLGILIVVAIAAGAGYLFLRQFSTPPPKPIFANDPEAVKDSPQAESTQSGSAPKTESDSTPSASASPQQSNETDGYQAQVVYPQGLILRDTPSLEANQVGGVGYEQTVTVLADSQDQQWQQIRLESGQEGWVKAGNTQRIDG